MRRLIWTAYLVMAAEGFIVYAVGFITPYVQSSLGVAPWLAQLPNSLMAVGMLLGGTIARGVNARYGADRTIRLWILGFVLSGLLLAVPVHIVVIVAGGSVFSASLGGWLVHVNSALGQGPSGSLLLTRANLWSVVGGLVGPLVLSAAASSIGWWYGVLTPVPLLVALAFATPGSPARDVAAADGRAEPPLPAAFWLAWLFLALCISAEFSYVVWGAQVVARRTGIPTEAATGLASLFVLGMVVGRLLASIARTEPGRQLPVLRAGALLTAAGAVLTWIAPQPWIAGVGLVLGGFGMSPIYPFGVSIALGHAPRAPIRASARLTLASGVAILGAPLVLGLVAGVAGIVAAWLIVVLILAGAFALSLGLRPPASEPIAVEVLAA